MVPSKRVSKTAGLLAAAALLTGCAFVRPGPPQAAPPATSAAPATEASAPAKEIGWHAVRFRFAWPEGADPAWHRDLLVAHRVAAPALAAVKDRIRLWRFHRRAVRDGAGHQFSFLFYADAGTAAVVMRAIGENPILKAIETAGSIERTIYSDPTAGAQPDVADTSDRNWSGAVQRTWPHFIMGASRMWLGLIEEAAGRDGRSPPTDPAALEDFYRDVEAEVTAAWRKEGRHALLHHLNALFGYGPVEVWELNLMRF